METRIVRRTPLLESRKYRVERLDTVTSRGAHHVDVIVHPGAAVILPLLDENRIILVRVDRPSVGETLLELPAGTLDPSEAPLDCARRELREETGYTANEIRPLLAFYSSPGFCTEVLHAFIATNLSPGEAQREVGEEIQNEIMTIDEALRAIEDGRIRDGKSIVALLFYSRRKSGARSA